MNSRTFRSVIGPRRSHGLSLIELMVALVLGLLVVGAAFSIFQSNQLTYRSNEGLNRMQENARVAFELISQDIRSAGGNSCSKYSLVDRNEGRVEAARFRDTPVSGNSTRLRLVGGDNVAYRVVSATSSSITLDPADITTPQVFEDGDVLLLCNPSKTFVVEVTNVSGTTVNFSPSLPAGVNITASPTGPTAAVLARMRDIEWFVDANGRGGTSLYMSRMAGDREEVAEGVENFAIGYLQSGSTTYVAAPAGDVIAVRVTMTLRGQNIEGRVFTRQSSSINNLRRGSLTQS